ncbi:TonB-dependent receptor [Segatella paludivivens]|uniref:TonB-dependent receptor n=1 Tax=Segatella paludivivens TaxID=185294 RepID=UPI0003A78207|nr:TonB-dependent receptor [Segatella paludivivens]
MILTLMAINAHAQQSIPISGRVLDAETRRPVEFVNVSLLGPDSTFLGGVVTDSLGNFSLSQDNYKSGEKYILKITHICYFKQILTTGPTDNICIMLQPNGYNLSQVNVRAMRTKVKNRQNLEYLVTDEMRKKCDLTSEILERIPSVFVDVNSNVYVKGSSNVLILKDGVKISHQSLLDLIPSGSVQKVIVSYHVPSRYASEDYTAVINLITKRIDGITLQFKPKVSFDKSWYDSKLNMNLEKGKSSFLLYYQFNYRNFAEHETTDISKVGRATDSISHIKVDPYKFNNNEFFAGYTYHPSTKVQIGAEGYWDIFRESKNKKYEDVSMPNYDFYHEHYNTQNYKAYATYTDSVNTMQLDVSYNNEDVDDWDHYFQPISTIYQKALKETYKSNFDCVTHFNKNLELNSGIKYYYVRNNGRYGYGDNISSDKYDGNSFSAYSEASINFSEALSLNAGISLYNYRRLFQNGIKVKSFNLYPKAVLTYSWKENNLVLGYSSNIYEPTLWELLPFLREERPNMYSKGTPTLKPEKNSKLSLEYSYSRGNSYLSFSPYYKESRNMIESEASSYQNGSLIDYFNLKKYHEEGIECTYSNDLFGWWTIQLNANESRQSIPDNIYYRKDRYCFNAQIVNFWTLSSRWAFLVQYVYNGKSLAYNGFTKSTDTSLAQLTYKVNHYLKLNLLFVQPFERREDKTCLYYKDGSVKTWRVEDVHRILLTCTFNFSKGKKSEKKDVYQNVDQKF